VLTFRHSFHARALSEQPELISEAAYEVLGIRWQIRCEMAGDQRPISSPPASSRPAAPAAQPPSKPSRPSGQTSTAPQGAAPGGADDWPEPAALGGTPQPPQAKPAATPAPPAEAAGDPRAVARAAASGRGRPAAPAADAEWAGEPPYDPEYDGPAQAAAPPEVAAQSVPYEGFDPGDVPTDEVIDEKTARQTSEQQAVQLLQQALGAERIGEVELK
jgi:DNA polymerase-3 subunit gamma/tau